MLRLIPLAVAVLVLLSLAPSVAASSLGLSATYEVLATLNYGQGTLVVDSTASVRNTTPAAVDSLQFNAVPARLGQMALELVSVDGTNVKAAIDDQTIIVPLPAALKPNAGSDVRIRYSARLRNNAQQREGQELALRQAQRHDPRLPLGPVAEQGSAVRPAQRWGPVRD